MDLEELIYDWNLPDTSLFLFRHDVEFQDETLRDGLQCPSVRDPSIDAKLEILHLMEALGIHGADVGLPGAGPRAVADVTRIVQEIVSSKLRIKPSCAGRTLKVDIDPIADIAEKTGRVLEADLFIGSSPIRQYAEGWDLDRLLRTTETAVTYAVERGLEVMYVTEDTVRSHPEHLRALYRTAIECGAKRICLCDTVGYATPDGVLALFEFMRGVVRETGEDVRMDWHGHRDRGLSIPNTLAAIEGGADRVHGTALGIGERVGNTPMDQILLNLRLMGVIDNDLTRLKDYVEVVARECAVAIPRGWPGLGANAFTTATGVYADAIMRALESGKPHLAERIHTSVPASLLGRTPQVGIGPLSGEATVMWWLRERGLPAEPRAVHRILYKAKQSRRLLDEAEIMAEVRG